MSRGIRALHLFALCGFAVAQPLLDLLAGGAEFFVARAATAADIVAIAVGLLALPPLLLWLAERALGLLSPRGERLLHRVLVGGLIGLTVLPPLLRVDAMPEALALALAILAGLGGAMIYARAALARQLCSVMAAAPIVFALIFALSDDVRGLLRPTVAPPPPASPLGGDVRVPLVLVIFDELATSSLLDDRDRIDPLRYPSFAALAEGSTWFRMASTVAHNTAAAIPAILTGRHPAGRARLPTLSEHPQNLFTLLGDQYVFNVTESLSLLNPRTDGNPPRAGQASGSLVTDLALIYLHLVVPASLRSELPSISDDWGDFWDRPASEERAEPDPRSMLSEAEARRPRAGERTKADAFHLFVDAIAETEASAAGDRGTLHFIHSTLPHGPWNLLPSGHSYRPNTSYGSKAGRWPAEPWWSVDAYRRHLLQVAHVDALLGQLVSELRRQALYDRALLVVLADHGLSLWPGTSRRRPEGQPHPEDILSVPLFIKRPGQTEGEVSMQVAETIDVLPTILDVLGIATPHQLDGRSLFRADRPAREGRRLFVQSRQTKSVRELRYPESVMRRGETLARKLALFGSGERELGLYRPAPHDALAGSSIDSFTLAGEPAGRVALKTPYPVPSALDDPPFAHGARLGLLPARVVGTLELELEPAGTPLVALAVSGIVETVVPAPSLADRNHFVSAMLPEDSVRKGLTDLRLFLVNADTSPATLVPLTISR